jgi:hypothetical protein
MKPFNYFDLVETFPLGGCVICRLTARDVERFIDSHLYEYVNTPDTHAMMRASRGLCAEHGAHLVEYGASVLGIAILHAAIVDELLKITASSPVASGGAAFARLRGDARKSASSLADKLEPSRACPACEILERGEAAHIRSLVDHLDEPKLEEAYRASQGLCLSHFRAALRVSSTPANLERLTAVQIAIWENLKGQLDEFARKYDINHADQAMGAEGDSWRRAIRLVSGDPDILGLRR